MQLRSLAVIALALSLVVPGAARAATVAYDEPSTSFTVSGGAGPDDLQIAFTSGVAGPHEGHGFGLLEVVDPSAPVSVAPGSERHCRAVDDHHVHCEGTPVLLRMTDDLTVTTGAGDDRISLTGSTVGAVLDGGAGRDAVTGGGGRDVLRVAGDEVADGDALDGGPGTDAIEVDGAAPGPVEVDLAAGRVAGPRGVASLADVEGATAVAPGVTLLGDDGPNTLIAGTGGRADGRGGDDDLRATSGPAALIGGDGNDRLVAALVGPDAPSVAGISADGGPGDDRLVVPGAASASCGPGRDVADVASLARPADCEGSPAWFGFLGGVSSNGHVMRVDLAPSRVGCGLRMQALTGAGHPVTEAIRTRGLGARRVRLPVRRTTVPAVVHLKVERAVRCPRRGRPWRFAPGPPASAVALR